MTLEPDDLERIFRREREFRDAIARANELQRPKPNWLGGLGTLLVKSIPADTIAKLITDGGKALIARRQEAEADKPIQPVQPKPPPVQKADGPRQPAVSGLVGTLDDDKAVETAKR